MAGFGKLGSVQPDVSLWWGGACSQAVTGHASCVSMGIAGTGGVEAGTKSRFGGNWAALLGEETGEPGL